jgi:hypothetical protein
LFANLENSSVPSGVPNVTGFNFSKNISVINGQKLVFFELVDTTLEQLLAQSSSLTNFGTSLKILDLTNTDNTSSVASNGGTSIKLNLINDALGLGDIIAIESNNSPIFDFTSLSGISLTGSVTVAREAFYNSSIGFYKIERADGTVLDKLTGALVAPSDARYKEVALRSDNLFNGFGSLSISANGTSTAAPIATFKDAGMIAPYGNVSITGETFFAFAKANSDGLNHFRTLGTNVLGFEDTKGGFDLDHDDLILNFNFNQQTIV